jgi:uncharacterized protein YrrD
VSHYVLGTSSLYELTLLPREKVLAVGDTFVTIHTSSDLITADQKGAKEILSEKYNLVGLDVFSKTGDRLGIVEGFSFDAPTGKIQEFTMNDGTVFHSGSFLFFSPEYVFVDLDALVPGAKSNQDQAVSKTAIESEKLNPVAETSVFEQVNNVSPSESIENAKISDEVNEDSSSVTKSDESANTTLEPVLAEAVAAELSEEVKAMHDLLIGAVLNADVKSEDGQFTALKGTTITQDVYDSAVKHDAVLLLTLSIDL